MSRRKEEWRDIPGYDGWYQASDWGRIRSFRCGGHKDYRRKTPKILNTHPRTVGEFTIVTVNVRKNGERSKDVPVARLIAITWLGGIPKGKRAYHKDGNPLNNRRWNIEIKAPFLEYNKNNPSKRKPVLKIDLTLEVLDCYKSARQAGRENGLGHRVILDYCNLLRQKTIIAPDGYIYAWDDDAWMQKTLQRAMPELDALGIRYNNPFTSKYYDLPPDPDLDIDPDILWSEAPACGGALESINS